MVNAVFIVCYYFMDYFLISNRQRVTLTFDLAFCNCWAKPSAEC